MAELFLSIVNMSISACWLVLAVLLLRLVLKKAPKWIICLLWGFAGLRLVMPFSLESIFSLIPSAETVSPEIMTATSPSVNTGIPALNNTINPVISESFAPEIGASANPLQILVPIAAAVWLVGIAVLLIYTLVSFLRLKKKIGTAVLLRDNIYQSENVASPFVLGIIKPKIYLPFNMSEQDTLLVIAHENAHIKRKDHLWKPLGFLILTLHWFNPLVWLGYVLLCRDIELACDERVIKGLDNVQRADYSQALLTCSVNRRSVAACPLAFGEVSVKDRVKSALSYKKPAFWIIVVAVVASVAVAVCFLTNPKKDKEYYDSGYSLQIVDETYIGTTQLPEKTDTYYFDVSNGTKGKLSNGARFEITMCNLQQGKLTVKLSGTALYSTTEAEPAVIKEIVVEEFTDGVVLTDKQYTHFYTFSFVRTQSLDEA
ncbi:MAG: M56 family metallopeptidase, partial [Clostridia bacterium]|nr:M56 family metallopeptidase [Clostridia bacterium]